MGKSLVGQGLVGCSTSPRSLFKGQVGNVFTLKLHPLGSHDIYAP